MTDKCLSALKVSFVVTQGLTFWTAKTMQVFEPLLNRSFPMSHCQILVVNLTMRLTTKEQRKGILLKFFKILAIIIQVTPFRIFDK
jgi:hypothetical protein